MLVGAGEGPGEGAAPPPKQKRNRYSVLYPVVLYSVRHAALAMLTPIPSPLAVSKSYFFSSHPFSGVRLFVYWFRPLAYGFRNVCTVYNHFLLLIYRACAWSISPSLMISSVRAHKWLITVPIPIVICRARARSISPCTSNTRTLLHGGACRGRPKGL